MNFFKKNKEIEIITPLEGNLDVQAFAEQYAKAGTIFCAFQRSIVISHG